MAKRPGRGRPPYPDLLTPAEWSAVEAARHGLSAGRAARRRGVSLDAVKYHLANVRQKLGLEDQAQVRGWTGVRRDSALFGKALDMDTPLQLGAIGQISRSVADIAKAEAWYRDTLGLSHLYTFGTLAFFDCGGVRLFLAQGESKADSILYFNVPDIRVAHLELLGRGVTFEGAPHLIHKHADGVEEWMAFFHDNEGRILALMSKVGAAGQHQS